MGLRSVAYEGAARYGAIVNAFRVRVPGIIVLIYHSISDSDEAITIPPNLFEQQIRWLQQHYPILSLDEALSTQDLSEDSVVLTFDDGFTDYYTQAIPFLLKHGIPSTVYPISDHVLHPDKPFTFSTGYQKQSMNARQLRNLAGEDLITIGSHTHTHRRMVDVSTEALETEVATSRAILEDVIQQDVVHFCYPWGVWDARSDREVRRCYDSAVTGEGGKNKAMTDPYLVKRIPVRRESLALFKHRVRGNLFLEYQARKLKNWLT